MTSNKSKPFEDSQDDTNAYWFVAHMDDVARAECDPEDAALLLWIAAEYLKNGEVVPKPLAEFIATAFERAAAVEKSKRPAELAAWLNLTAQNKRPKIPTNELGCWMFRQLSENPNQSETSALNIAAEINRISKTTATDHWHEWKRKNTKLIEMLEGIRALKQKA